MFALIVCLVLFLLISVTAAAILDAGLIVKPRAQFAQNGFLNLIPKSLPSVLLIPKREVRVWLPPDYHSGPDRTQRHPVLYCHDGQHVLLNEEDTFPPKRSWRLGVTLTNLIKEEQLALPAPIVVLIDNCHKDGVNILGDIDVLGQPLSRRRWIEYGEGPIGETFIDWVCDELKPAIDAEFRTKTGPEDTYAMGSSMGGLVSFNSIWRRPDVFGHAACLSPCFQAPLLAQVAMQGRERIDPDARIYIDNGGDTDEVKVSPIPNSIPDGINAGWWWLDTNLQFGVDVMCAALRVQGVPFCYYREPGGRHNEAAWAARLHRPLLHLFGHHKESERQG